ncbi:hypothetical protein DL96DRAFT_481233 [Flagelloscypha sp. PMI_526]|nr:hypothetical protein DL96DRAFT_481233 [Flagelloscypha sp. PMI_526]
MKGPWFSKKDTSGSEYYLPDCWIVRVLELLCTAFKENLSELRLTMFNAEHLSDCLVTIPSLHQFPKLKILDLNFSRAFGNYEYSTDDFRVFIAHFRDTLCVLRLKFMNLGEDPLKLFLAQHQNTFPCLSTLDLHYAMNSNAPYRKGYPHLTNFLTQCPVLRRLVLRESGHIVPGGITNDIQEQFDLPEGLPLSELAFDDWSWVTHHLSLNKLLGGEKSQVRVLDCTARTSSDFVEDMCRSAGLGFCHHLTNLTLKIVRFYVHDFIHQVNELHSLEVLEVTCKYLALRYPQYIPIYPPSVIPISDSKSEVMYILLTLPGPF